MMMVRQVAVVPEVALARSPLAGPTLDACVGTKLLYATCALDIAAIRSR